MAALTTADVQLIEATLQGFLDARMPENFSLAASGVIQVDQRKSDAAMQQGGNTVQWRGDVPYRGTWQTPTAATDLTINSYDTYQSQFPLFARADVLGVEDIAAVAAGDPRAVAKLEMKLRNAYTYNLETLILGNGDGSTYTGLLKALFEEGGCLNQTHTKTHASAQFEPEMIEEALIVLGDLPDTDMVILTAPTAYRRTKMHLVAEGKTDDIRTMYAQTGTLYGGVIGGRPVFVNARIKQNADGTWPVYVMRRGVIPWIIQMDYGIEVDRDTLKAGGTDYVKYLIRAGVGLEGLKYNGTEATTIGGATDTAIGTASNWIKEVSVDSATIDDSLIQAVCIRALADGV